jgi:flagellar motility protein MotE (MotC chaperone)
MKTRRALHFGFLSLAMTVWFAIDGTLPQSAAASQRAWGAAGVLSASIALPPPFFVTAIVQAKPEAKDKKTEAPAKEEKPAPEKKKDAGAPKSKEPGKTSQQPAVEESKPATPPPELPKLPSQNSVLNPETLRLLEMIEKKNNEIQRREEELRIKEEQLKNLEQKLLADLKKIDEVVAKSQEQLGIRKDLVDKNINSLVKVYSTMKPDEAATLLGVLEEDVSLQIISKMKSKTAGQVLSRMDKKIAKNISEKLAGVKATGLNAKEETPTP